MHSASFKGMWLVLEALAYEKASVLDVGSACVHTGNMGNITYRGIANAFGWEYTGVDIEAGDNVDIVMAGAYRIPVPDASFDIVISGQCIEHVKNPFRLISEAVRALKPGGPMVITAPHKWRIHRYPIDTFRYNPDGMAAILEESGCEVMKTYLGEADSQGRQDCWGIGRKL